MKSSSNFSKKLIGALFAIILSLASISAAQAQIVLNGNFSQGLTDWTTYGQSTTPGSNWGGPTDSIGFPAVNVLQYISQSIPTSAGEVYTLSFSMASEGTPDELLANVGGTLGTFGGYAGSGLPDYISGGTNLIDLVNIPYSNPVFTTYSANFTAGLGTTTNLSFAGYSNPGAVLLTDVSVSPLSTPEPSTWALLLGGLGLLAFMRTRRARI